MEIFAFVRWVLVITVTVTLFWPLTVPLAALAYKVRLGPQPIPMENGPFWTRCTFAALGMAIFALILSALDAMVCESGFPVGIVHTAVLMAYVPVAVWFLTLMFALDDMGEGLSLLVIWIFLPGLLLGAFNLLFGFDLPQALAESWLRKIPT
ncbi:MAG TPA: hypothetical protein VEL76_26190 [Gemmataceae bacterium]|nr:hypothetical protein [Gemmataceae bacterium]